MALQREVIETFTAGSVLMGAPDQLAPSAVRLLKNARLDRTLRTISSRPGISQRTSGALSGSIAALHKRYAAAGDTGYAHAETSLYRLDSSFTAGSSIATVGVTATSAATMADGESGIWTYFVNGTLRGKDNGTTLRTIGIAAPANPPSVTALATDLSTTIDAMDAAASWTGASLSAGPTDETNIKQEGSGSVTFTIAANTIGSIGIGTLGGGTGFLNLDTLTSGDATVKADDYIYLQLRCDRPDRVEYAQLDFDLDTQTLANAFRTNYYSIRLPSFSRLNQGRDQWNKLQIRKSEFERFGTSAAVSWATVKSARISASTTNDGSVVFYVDDFKLRGGTDIEGDVEYTIAYRNDVTGGRGNPALSSTGAVRYTTPLTVDRQRVTVTITNVREGGADHPGDAQIDTLILYRRINGGNSVNIVEVADTTANPYTDSISVFATLLNETLESTSDFPSNEAENDAPPAAEVVFGPGPYNRLFYLLGNRLYFSKAWEPHENRAENVPPLNYALIAGGSETALAGLASDTAVLVWTTRQTYQIVGSGEETFLPVPIPNSRGIVGRYALDDGDGRVFFLAHDGLYEQVGLQQRLVVDMGETLTSSFININTDAAALATVRLQWHADTHSPYVCLLIPTGSNTTPDSRLVVKKNSVTGQYTDAILDTSAAITGTALLADDASNTLLMGSSAGRIYALEQHSLDSDDSTGFVFQARTRAHHQSTPQRDKQYSEYVVEANTSGQALTVTAYYDKGGSAEALGTLSTTTDVGVGLFAPVDPLAMRQDYALDLTGTVTSRVTVYRYGVWYEPQVEAVTFYDTGVLVFPVTAVLKRFDLDIHAPALVTLQPYYDGVAGQALTVLPTSGRQYTFVYVPPNVKPRTVRVTLTSTMAFRPYGEWARIKPLGAQIGYTEQNLLLRRVA